MHEKNLTLAIQISYNVYLSNLTALINVGQRPKVFYTHATKL
jgi:hypothetical protein